MKMMIFFRALVLIFILSFNEIDASDRLKQISTERKSSRKDKESISPLATSRSHRQAYPTYNQNSIAHQALNLDSYHPGPSGSSNQQTLPGVLDFMKQNLYGRPAPPQVPQFQRSREHHHRENTEVTPSSYSISHELVFDTKYNMLVSKPIGNVQIDRPTKNELSAQITSQAEPTKKRRELTIQEPIYPQNIVESGTMNLHAAREIGHPEINESVTEVGYRRRKTIDGRAAAGTDVSNSHIKFTQPSQLPPNAFENYEPYLINNTLNQYIDTYHDFPSGFPNGNPNPDHHGHQH